MYIFSLLKNSFRTKSTIEVRHEKGFFFIFIYLYFFSYLNKNNVQK